MGYQYVITNQNHSLEGRWEVAYKGFYGKKKKNHKTLCSSVTLFVVIVVTTCPSSPGSMQVFLPPEGLTNLGDASPSQDNVFCAQLQRFQIKSMNERGLHSWHAENCYKKFPFLCKRSACSSSRQTCSSCTPIHLWTVVTLCFLLTGQTCVDIKDNVVNEGYYFTPKGDDPCLSCTCHDGEPEMCVAALCERPQGCQHFRKDPKECCKFTCLDPGARNQQSQPLSASKEELFYFE